MKAPSNACAADLDAFRAEVEGKLRGALVALVRLARDPRFDDGEIEEAIASTAQILTAGYLRDMEKTYGVAYAARDSELVAGSGGLQ